MAYSTRIVDSVAILELDGEVDLYHSPRVREEIGKLISKKNPTILINFQKVSYIDSSGLATIIDAFQKMRAYKGRLALAALSKPVLSVFEVARLNQYFQIFENEGAALGALTTPKA
ncbi:MAG: STAS domain-containing protein [Verrucomicrobiae bacterium]|nr:STAS domain-containing protein [Verrucomicrobiae bacterium]